MSGYLIDSNFFIQAHRAIYPLDVVPSFWLKAKSLSENGTIQSIDKVKKEIFDDSAHDGVKTTYLTIFSLSQKKF